MAVEMRHVVEPEFDRLARVDFSHPGLREMRDGAHLLLLRLVESRREDCGRIAVEEFDTPIALRLGPADPFARLGWGVGRSARPFIAKDGVGDQARSGDGVGGAAARVRKVGRIGAEVEADAADGGHAMREPQLVAIGWLRRFRSIAIVAMHIDEAGQDIHALGIDHALHVLRLGGGRAAGIERSDAIAFDHDVDRSRRRGTAALDHRCAADQQLAEGTFALVGGARGHGLHLRDQRLRRYHGQGGQRIFPGCHSFPLDRRYG